MLVVHWSGGESFEGVTENGHSILLGHPPENISPVEAFLAAAASCSAIDVIGILHKMRQEVAAYRIEVEWERGPMDIYPRPVISMTVRHIVIGMEIDPAAVEKAVRLSDEKYCGILATLRRPPKITTEFAVELPGDPVE